MEAETHPDLIQDAVRNTLQAAMEVLSVGAAAAQAVGRHTRIRAEHDQHRRRALIEQARQHRAMARLRWAPALDDRWLRDASLIETARIWGAAVPYANRASRWFDRTAESAMYKCEQRLRTLHPHAMSRYDRLRDDGLTPAEAMRQSAPFFKRPPNVRAGSWAPRPSLVAGDGLGHSWVAAEHGPSRVEWQAYVTAEAQTRRADQIIRASQDQARADGRGLLGQAEQRLKLETATNLPQGVIDAAVRPRSPIAAEHQRPRQPWAQDFPIPIEQILAMVPGPESAGPPTQQPAKRAAIRQAPRPAPGRGA